MKWPTCRHCGAKVRLEGRDAVDAHGGLYCREPVDADVRHEVSEQSPLWLNNEVQFARLLCELVANCDDLKIRDVCESMDLSQDELNELFDRANDVWENAKLKFCRP